MMDWGYLSKKNLVKLVSDIKDGILNNRERLLKGSIWILLVAFLAFSVAALFPDAHVDHDNGMASAELTKQEITEGNSITTCYVNADGIVTFAIDKGFASVYKLKNSDGKVVEEYYYDETNNPILKSNNYHGITYEYREGCVWITYVNEKRMPMMCNSGYAYILRTQDDKGRSVDDFYFDLDMKPVLCSGGYYGLHREYDEKEQNNRIMFLNEEGLPMNGTGGYTVRTYLRDEKGTVIEERFFDEQDKPVKSTSGQYGERYVNDENGRRIQTIYLGAEGDPSPVYAGYVSIKRTYNKDGTINTEMYFDEKGAPTALSKGQYGVKYWGKARLLLNEDGKIMFCLDNMLNGNVYLTVIIGCLLCVSILLLPKKYSIILTGIYVLFIFYETMLFRVRGGIVTNFQLLSYAGSFWKEESVRVHVIQNFWLFVPFGAGLYRIFQKKWVFIVPLLFSLAIEFTQYLFHIGFADINDVFENAVGGILGILLAMVLPFRSEISGTKDRK